MLVRRGFFFVVVVLLSFFRSSKWLFSPTHFSPTTTSVLGKITPDKGLNLYIFVDYIHYGGILLKFKTQFRNSKRPSIFQECNLGGSVLVFAEWLLGLARPPLLPAAVINGAMPNLL